MRKILLTIVICLSLISAVPASAKSVGVFTEISGTVEIRSLYEDASRQAKMGENVNVSDAIYAHDNARAEVTFHDGNVIRLASKTRIEVKDYAMRGSESSEVIKLLRGKLRNIVKVVFDTDFQKKKGKYEIHTPIAVCGVRGTDFFAYHEQEVSGAAFVTGRGYAYNRDVPDEVVTLTAGQQMTARTGREAPKVAPARSKDIDKLKKATLSKAKIDKKQTIATPTIETPAVATPAVATPTGATPTGATPAVATPAVATPAVATPTGATPTSGSSNSGVGKSAGGNSGGGNSGGGNSDGGNSGGGNSDGGNSDGGNSGGGNSGGGNSDGGNSGGGNSDGGNSGGGNSGGGNSGGGNSGGGNSGGGNSGGGNSGGGNSGGGKK